ncbi:MAG: lysophospholipid acyltransferase family protein [Lysobacterales bacterium]
MATDAPASDTAKLPPMQPAIPRWSGRWLWRILGWLIVHASRWRVTGEFPNRARLVVIAAPHSSAWDGVFGIAAAMTLGLRPTWMAKDSLFRGPLGWLLRQLGGVATDRSNPSGVVGQTVAALRQSPAMWLVLAPEATRRKVAKWRTGFYHIAVGAGVPILPVYFHYPERRIGIGELFHPTGDMDADLRALYEIYRPWRGKDGKSAVPD